MALIEGLPELLQSLDAVLEEQFTTFLSLGRPTTLVIFCWIFSSLMYDFPDFKLCGSPSLKCTYHR